MQRLPVPMLSRERAIEEAARLMLAFAERTGLSSEREPQRYLWTDAFAVCTFLALARATRDESYTTLALRLVDQVHHVLGRHRRDDSRTGWLSGLAEREGESHPTVGGLRIGKKLPERARGEPFDERLEWERDGQYFHYLTKWMFALDQVSRATGQARFNLWACELAEVAHAAFVYPARGPDGLRMIWKASIDLSRPLVSSMGQHDPLDGFVTCAQLQATATALFGSSDAPDFSEMLADFAFMLEEQSPETSDPLGLGGLMLDASRVAQLTGSGLFPSRLFETLLEAALAGLSRHVGDEARQRLAWRSPAFRQLGLAIGLHAIHLARERVVRQRGALPGNGRCDVTLQALTACVPLASAIETFCLEPKRRSSAAWCEHRDINDVMLATSLVPEGCVLFAPAAD